MEPITENNDSKIYSISVFVLALSLILSNSLYTSIHLFSILSKLLIFSSSFVLFIVGIFFLKSNLTNVIRTYSLYLFIVIIFFIEQVLRAQISANKLLLLIAFPLLIIPFLVMERERNSIVFFRYFCNIMVFIASCSLLFTMVGLLGVPLNSSITSLWSGGTIVGGYFHLHFFPGGTQKIPFLFFHILRNSSIFPESPIFGYYLSLALVFQNFIINRNRFVDLQSFIIYIAIITTASTTSLFIAIGVFVIKSIIFIRNKTIKKIYMFFLFVLLIVALEYIIQFKLKNSLGSVSIRSDDFRAGMMAFLDHPIFGNGFNNLSSIEAYMDANRLSYNPEAIALGLNRAGFSLGLPEMLALGGFYYAFFWLIFPSYLYVKKFYKCLLAWIPCFNLLLVSLLIINDTYMFIFTIVYFYVYGIYTNNKSGSESE